VGQHDALGDPVVPEGIDQGADPVGTVRVDWLWFDCFV